MKFPFKKMNDLLFVSRFFIIFFYNLVYLKKGDEYDVNLSI